MFIPLLFCLIIDMLYIIYIIIYIYKIFLQTYNNIKSDKLNDDFFF